MPDNALPSAVEKRVRYFDGQFLQDQDFIDEQNYQLDREHRHNRLLHGPGIAEGLTVTSAAPNQVTVAPGTAIDSEGRQLVLAQATTVDLPGADFNDKQGVELLLSYRENAEDPQTAGGSQDFTRWLERPKLTARAPDKTYSGTEPPVLLAKVGLDAAGRVEVDSTVRSYSGLRLPGSGADPATLRATSGDRVHLAGSLTVDGSIGVGTTNHPTAKLEVVGRGGKSVDLVVNGQLKSDNEDGGLWVASDRFVGGFETNKLGFYNGDAWRLAVLPDGNVGVGTADPTAKLHVNGSVYAHNFRIGNVTIGEMELRILQRLAAGPLLTIDTPIVVKGAPLTVHYSTAPGTVSSTNWIGIYPAAETVPKTRGYTTYKYAPGADGSVTLDTGTVPGPGRYAAWYFYDNGYTTLADPVIFTVT
ncbi:hypothetical protein [Microbispora sp. CA-102843]|uniref:hypothetical protein n=1 Tax=Microbispora sp. CA-102843 TaxID=3239952 RepID=UPI003D89BFF1